MTLRFWVAPKLAYILFAFSYDDKELTYIN